MAARETPATRAAARAGIQFATHEYEHDPKAESYGSEAAERMGVQPDRVFKTLLAEVDAKLTVAVVPVNRQLDLKSLAAAIGAKRATMADGAAAERATGYVVGGISPIGQRKALATFIDQSASNFETVFVSAGRRGLEIELSPADLLRLTDGAMAVLSHA